MTEQQMDEALQQLEAIERYLDKNWLDTDFCLDKVWLAVSLAAKHLSIPQEEDPLC